MIDEVLGTDAEIWAKAFCKRYPVALCAIEGKEGATLGDDFEDTMRGWFANAIETGRDAGYWKGREDGFDDGREDYEYD